MAMKYYNMDGVPVKWDDAENKLPVKVRGEEEEVVYSLEKFFQEAMPIRKSQFDELVSIHADRAKKK
jgi:hypothetical protein